MTIPRQESSEETCSQINPVSISLSHFPIRNNGIYPRDYCDDTVRLSIKWDNLNYPEQSPAHKCLSLFPILQHRRQSGKWKLNQKSNSEKPKTNSTMNIPIFMIFLTGKSLTKSLFTICLARCSKPEAGIKVRHTALRRSDKNTRAQSVAQKHGGPEPSGTQGLRSYILQCPPRTSLWCITVQ